ncbi:MAG TPA: ParB/RepB/Spo0J family partition protein [Parvibaculum sp.]|uniref:ParB/RepB/Spo0J family partition protein n=1 Tax=Parvibaculum sp. TaxID=2024848 RepID=UPI002C6D268A|nr:ParB/RepB/Spo0J family partition protein [Parvibaculum sp.]HMM15830.1 ParB/RepB/Spo0J family partition protein [Parvibaculum sp.]
MMMAEESPSRLGRGLAALIGDDAAFALGDAGAPAPRGVREVPIEFLRANPFQPRHVFREEELVDLANSIREKGILQPIVVRPVQGASDAYEIVAGERRWRAAQKAQLHQVPVIVKELTDAESLEIAIIENVQRADLNAIEEGLGYDRLMQQFQYTQEQLSKLIGKSRSHVANTLRLLGLPQAVRNLVEDGKLSAGHARTLIGVPNAEELAREIVAKGLSVRDAETLTRKATTGSEAPRRSASASSEKDADTLALERNISDQLGLKVEISFAGEKGGDVRIHYKSLEQLDEICRRLAGRGNPRINGAD